jgi:hypothetical protein
MVDARPSALGRAGTRIMWMAPVGRREAPGIVIDVCIAAASRRAAGAADLNRSQGVRRATRGLET